MVTQTQFCPPSLSRMNKNGDVLFHCSLLRTRNSVHLSARTRSLLGRITPLSSLTGNSQPNPALKHSVLAYPLPDSQQSPCLRHQSRLPGQPCRIARQRRMISTTEPTIQAKTAIQRIVTKSTKRSVGRRSTTPSAKRQFHEQLQRPIRERKKGSRKPQAS